MVGPSGNGHSRSIGQASEDYLASLRAKGRYSNTLRYYDRQLERFADWCDRRGVTTVAQLDQALLDTYATEILGMKISRYTAESYLQSVRQMLKWLREEGETRAQLFKPRLPQRVVNVLSRQEIGRMEAACRTERDRLIVRLLGETGIRHSELRGLRLNDLVKHGVRTYIHVRGKRGKERLVPVTPSLWRRLKLYAAATRPSDAHSDILFLSLRRQSGSYQPLGADGVLDVLHNAAETAGVAKRVYAHLFRHSAATWLLRETKDLVAVATILGHSSLDTTMGYIRMDPEHAHEALMKAMEAEE